MVYLVCIGSPTGKMEEKKKKKPQKENEALGNSGIIVGTKWLVKCTGIRRQQYTLCLPATANHFCFDLPLFFFFFFSNK
jgi:hypothetical protein